MNRFLVEEKLSGDEYTIELDKKDFVLLHSILEFVSRYDFQGKILEDEMWMAKDLSKNMEYYLNDEVYQVINNK